MADKPTGKLAVCIMLMVTMVFGCAQLRHVGGKKEMRETTLPTPEASAIWRYITETAPYLKWNLYPPQKGLYPSMRRGLTPAKNPHGAYLKLFGNEIAIKAAEKAEGNPMPNGAILIKEDFDKDKTTLKSVTIMYKIDGYNPQEGDWFWGRYAPDGRVMEAGKAQSCIECHRTQHRHDWRFTGAISHH